MSRESIKQAAKEAREKLVKAYKEMAQNEIEVQPPGSPMTKEMLVAKKVMEFQEILEFKGLHESFVEALKIIRDTVPQVVSAEERAHFDEDMAHTVESLPSVIMENPPTKTQQEILGVTDFALNCMHKVGRKLLLEKDLDRAEKVFRALIYLNPFVVDYLLSLGLVKQSQEQWPEAQMLFMAAVQNEPENPQACMLFALASNQQGDKDIAKEFIQISEGILQEKPEWAHLKPQLDDIKKLIL